MKLWRFAVLWLIAGSCPVSVQLYAQKPLKMTIEELFAQVEQTNTEVEAARKDVYISRHLKKASKAKWFPDIDLAAGVNYLGDGIVLDRNFSNPVSSPLPHLGNTLSVSLYQPLYAGGEITAGVKKMDYEMQMASADLEIVTDKVKIDVLDCYLSLLKNRNLLNVYDENIKLTKQLILEMEARSKQGLVLANDVTRYELNLSNLNYDRITVANAIEHLNYSLLLYLGLDENTVIEPALDHDGILLPDVELSEWKEMVSESSPELRRLDIAHLQAKTEEKIVRSQMLPKIGLTAGNNLEGPIKNTSPVLDNNLNTWWVGLKFSFSLSSLYKERGTLSAAKIETAKLADDRKVREEDIDRQLDQVYKYYIEACEQVETQRKNVELAMENYRIVEQRYSADISLLTDMLDASAAKLDAEVRLVNAQVNVIFYYYQLKYMTGNI